MKMSLIAVACVLSLAITAAAQDKPSVAKPTQIAPALEAKVRKVWQDFKNKNKESLAAALSDNFRQVEEGSSGFGDKKAQIASVDEFQLKSYTLKEFTVKPLGSQSALVTYLAHYEGTSGGEAVTSNSAFGEVWVREGNTWKGLYTQETGLK